MNILFALLLGFVVGIVINLLADYLPARRHYTLARSSPFSTVKPVLPVFFPRRTDGTNWSPLYWSGVYTALTRAAVYDPPRTVRRLLVEVGLAVAYPLIVLTFQHDEVFAAHLGYLLFYLPALTLIAVIDLEHRFVMIETILVPAAVVIIEQTTMPHLPLWLILRTAATAFGILLALYLLGLAFGVVVRLVSGRRIGRTILGFGDVQIATLGGLILGKEPLLVPALFIMAFTGGIGALAFILLRQRRRGKYRRYSAIPYGPFICLGVAVALYMPTLAGWVTLLAFGYTPQ